MQLVAPDILTEARGLSLTVSVTGLALGLLLWLLGGRSHRFWVVLVTTTLAGVLGLYAGPAYGVQPLVAGLLMAVAAGALALALARVVAFAAGGLAAWMLVHAVAPSWNEPLISFMAGGLVGLVLFRVWIMCVTSLAGTVLIAYSILCLAEQLGKIDAVGWVTAQAAWLNWACGGATLMGVLVQFVLDRSRARRERERLEVERERAVKDKEKAARDKEKERKASRKRSWWGYLRRAG